jgi:tRNA-dihydrouridine synthase 1
MWVRANPDSNSQGNLSNPCLFVPETSPLSHPPSWIVANHYLDIVEKLKTPTSMSAIRAHMFRMLRAGIEKHTDVRARLASGSGNLAFYRSIVEELRPLLEKDMEEEPIAEFPLPCHPETGLKRIPVWAAQPYVRPLPAGTYKAIKDANSRSAEGTATPGVLEDMLTGGTGEERVIAQGKPRSALLCLISCLHGPISSDGTAAGLAQPLLPEAINCMIGGDPECKNIAAANCPRTACLTHCRAQGGLEAGRAENLADAVKLAQGGKLTGLGCEGHEEKDRARKQRKAEQKKAYQEHKAMRRSKRNRGKSVEGDDRPDAKKVKVNEVQPEEEEVNNV